MNSFIPTSVQEAVAWSRNLFNELEQNSNEIEAVFWPSCLYRYLNALGPNYSWDWAVRFAYDYLQTQKIRSMARLNPLLEALMSQSSLSNAISEELRAESERIWYLSMASSDLSPQELDNEVLGQRLVSCLYAWKAMFLEGESKAKLDRNGFSRVIRMISHLHGFSEEFFWKFLENHLKHFVDSLGPNE